MSTIDWDAKEGQTLQISASHGSVDLFSLLLHLLNLMLPVKSLCLPVTNILVFANEIPIFAGAIPVAIPTASWPALKRSAVLRQESLWKLMHLGKWVCLKIVYPYTQWLMIIIPTKWL